MDVKEKETFKQEDLRQWLQTWITTAIFCLAAYFFSAWALGIPVDLVKILALSLISTLVIGFLMERWRIGLFVLVILGGLYLIQFLFHAQIQVPILSLKSFQYFIKHLGEIFRFIFQKSEITSRPEDLARSLHFFISFLAVLTNWILPIPLLNMLFLVTPLFRIEDFSSRPGWLFLLMAGLFCVYASYAFRQDPDNRDQRPPIVFGLVLLGVTFLLQLLIPPEAFFFPKLSQKINDILPSEGGEITSFSLDQLGYYPQGKKMIGGPVDLSKEAFLSISSQSPAFYLRGSAFNHFDGRSWSMKGDQTLQRYDWKGDYFDDFTSDTSRVFWFDSPQKRDQALAQDKLFVPSIYVLKEEETGRIVFHAGRPVGLSLLNQKMDPSKPIEDNAKKLGQGNSFYFSQGGVLASEIPYNSYGLVVMDYIAPIRDNIKLEKFKDFKVKKGEGVRQYEEEVRRLDPSLADLVYDKDLGFYDLILALREYFENYYAYSLNVPEIPEDQDFFSAFLDDRRGYCVYFATTYSVLLGDVGYPVRYAEGFVVPQTNSQVGEGEEEAGQWETRTLTPLNGHAWMEVYLEEIGWYPIETTPIRHIAKLAGFEGETGLADLQDQADQDQEKPEEDLEEEKEDQAPEEDQEEKQEEEQVEKPDQAQADSKESQAWKIIIPILLIMVLVAAFFIKKYKAWSDRMKGVRPTGLNDEKFVKLVWNHCKRLVILQDGKFDPPETIRTALKQIEVLLPEYDITPLRNALEGLLYGGHGLTDENMAEMVDLYRKLDENYKKSVKKWTWWKNDVLGVKGKPW